MKTTRARKTERLPTRATPELKRMAQHAAALEVQSLTDFVEASIRERAERAIRAQLDEVSRKKLRVYTVLPALLVGRLAVDNGFQGAGLGWLLMMHALRACLEISYQTGSMSVVVDALDEQAARF